MDEKKIIYCVEDEQPIRELYTCALENAGYECSCFVNAEDFFNAVKIKTPSLIILDIMLGGQDGFKILQKLKENKQTKKIPVIMVSAKDEEISKVKGLNMGAEDYIAKPFGVMELMARIKVCLRSKNEVVEDIVYKDITIQDEKRQILLKDQVLDLTLKEYNLLKILVLKADTVVERSEILDYVWGATYIGETRTLDIHIATLRKKIKGSSVKINTIRGVGYTLV